MLFNSLLFAIFFPTVVMLYFAIPYRFRWILLLAASYYFYMCWRAEYIILIVISTIIDYFAAIKMSETEDKSKRKKFLYLSLFGNLGMLFLFKYYNFFNTSISSVFNQFNIFYNSPSFKLLLPVGISFYTFQTLSYTIEVYRGNQKPERHFGIFALYVSFFPQLVAGPIERSTNLLPQFYRKNDFDYNRVKHGLMQMAWGFFKKLVIADRLGAYVNTVYNSPGNYSGIPLILATYFFAFQIYCDFSGYSDIAIGASRIMGYDLMKNFNRPYFSKSISEFWSRWHISLSSWFRDYVYISLGGNRVSKWKWYRNLFITFMISGLWHGANWTFILWGSLHGFYLIFSIWTKDIRQKIAEFTRLAEYPTIHKWFKILVTFHLVLISWVFFRANSISDAMTIFSRMTIFNFENLGSIGNVTKLGVLISIFVIIIMEVIHILQSKMNFYEVLIKKSLLFRWSIYSIFVFLIILLGDFGGKVDFIYFQF
jgi:alginate O-acetyltransferase complex protein AlgI